MQDPSERIVHYKKGDLQEGCYILIREAVFMNLKCIALVKGIQFQAEKVSANVGFKLLTRKTTIRLFHDSFFQ